MVDASVGGKTGFDHAHGKNLIGAFFQPSHVVVDLDHLSTLPPREVAAGHAEIVKIALACDAKLLYYVVARESQSLLEDTNARQTSAGGDVVDGFDLLLSTIDGGEDSDPSLGAAQDFDGVGYLLSGIRAYV